MWLLGPGAALAQNAPSQDAPSGAALQAEPAPAAIVLSDDRTTHALERRSRYWIDPIGNRTASQVEATADTLPWNLREAGSSYNIDGKALWLQFDAVNRVCRGALRITGNAGQRCGAAAAPRSTSTCPCGRCSPTRWWGRRA